MGPDLLDQILRATRYGYTVGFAKPSDPIGGLVITIREQGGSTYIQQVVDGYQIYRAVVDIVALTIERMIDELLVTS